MIKDITYLANNFRKYYKCNTQPGLVENMLLAVAGRTPEQCVDSLTEKEIRQINNWLKNPPFKTRSFFGDDAKKVIRFGLVTGAVIGVWGWLQR